MTDNAVPALGRREFTRWFWRQLTSMRTALFLLLLLAIAAVLGLSFSADDASAARGAFLALTYCLGLGIPFVLAALGFGRFMRAVSWFKRNQRLVSIIGGVLLIAVGVMLVTGWWEDLVGEMQTWVSGFEAPV